MTRQITLEDSQLPKDKNTFFVRPHTVMEDVPLELATITKTFFTARCSKCGSDCGQHIVIVEIKSYVAHNLEHPSVDKFVLCTSCAKAIKVDMKAPVSGGEYR